MSLAVNAKGLAEACGFKKGRISQFKSKGIITKMNRGFMIWRRIPSGSADLLTLGVELPDTI
jgi:phage terminase Nu1 subunit (DNA packaging protein)